MAVTLTEDKIIGLIRELKPLPVDYRKRMIRKPKRGHREQEMTIQGAEGSEFVVIMRESKHNPLDFSVILGYRPPESNLVFRLQRYNGKAHEHTNKLEGNTFFDFHVHQATERYQDSGFREDAYAERTDRFSDLNSAVECMIDECGFQRPPDVEMPLFE